MICFVIIAGGRGERFWPKSRATKPKQFTDITGTGSMLRLTYDRIKETAAPERIFVVTGSEYEGRTRQCLPELPVRNIIAEPEGRSTAPCIGLAAAVLEKRWPGATMVVLPADHLIKEEDNFRRTLETAVTLANATEGLVTVGIRPTRAETGYGYLETGEPVKVEPDGSAYRVQRFVEKPDAARAGQFLREGRYLWNAGIFVWKTDVIMKAFSRHLPEMYSGLLEIARHVDTDEYQAVLGRIYPGLQKVSIDYGIMEKVSEVYTVPGDFAWDDVGTWHALERVCCPDAQGNIIMGNVVALNAKNSIIEAGQRLVAVIGVEDLVIVETDDVTFICSKDKTDQIRELLARFPSLNLEKYL